LLSVGQTGVIWHISVPINSNSRMESHSTREMVLKNVNKASSMSQRAHLMIVRVKVSSVIDMLKKTSMPILKEEICLVRVSKLKIKWGKGSSCFFLTLKTRL
jgi:hypothetical protein